MLQYSQFNSYLQTGCCGSISCCVGMCFGAVARCASYAYQAHLATAPQHIPTQHDMLPQQPVCKYELNCEYRNITLARNKALWWWYDKIETCRSQTIHQLDATLCRFYFCRVILHVSGASAHHQEHLKLVQRPLVRVLLLHVSHHISLIGPELNPFKTSTAATGTCVIVARKSSHLLISSGPNKMMWWLTCNNSTCTNGRCTSFKCSWWWALAPETCRVTLKK